MQYTERTLWRVIEFADWGVRTDYRFIGAEMALVFSKEVIEAARDLYRDKLEEIKTVLEAHALVKTGSKYGYYGVGDDGFWDLRAHIIGLGEKVYNEVLSDPERAKKMVDNREHQENFGYIFQYALPELFGKSRDMKVETIEEEPELFKIKARLKEAEILLRKLLNSGQWFISALEFETIEDGESLEAGIKEFLNRKEG